jgi:hypothetical protein
MSDSLHRHLQEHKPERVPDPCNVVAVYIDVPIRPLELARVFVDGHHQHVVVPLDAEQRVLFLSENAPERFAEFLAEELDGREPVKFARPSKGGDLVFRPLRRDEGREQYAKRLEELQRADARAAGKARDRALAERAPDRFAAYYAEELEAVDLSPSTLERVMSSADLSPAPKEKFSREQQLVAERVELLDKLVGNGGRAFGPATSSVSRQGVERFSRR